MKPADHSRELEQVMAYVDGMLDGQAAESVRLHLARCSECRQAEQDLRGVSDRLQSWHVDAAPDRLRAPVAAVKKPSRSSLLAWMLSPGGLVAAAAGVVFIVIAGGALLQPRKSMTVSVGGEAIGEESKLSATVTTGADKEAAQAAKEAFEYAKPLASPVEPSQAVTPQGPMIVRTARLTIVASDYEAARAELERVVQRAGGFIGQIVAHGATGAPRRLEATLRVPTPRLDETIAALRRLGQVIGEAQDGEDVAQQSADLNTRLENARVSEKRLRDILAQRTGKLADVLDVEREIARVRGAIEQMESERRSLDRRVTYATITISVSEDRKSEVNLGPVPVSRRFRNAFVEGWANAIGTAVDATVFLVRAAPTLLLWTLILVPIVGIAKKGTAVLFPRS